MSLKIQTRSKTTFSLSWKKKDEIFCNSEEEFQGTRRACIGTLECQSLTGTSQGWASWKLSWKEAWWAPMCLVKGKEQQDDQCWKGLLGHYLHSQEAERDICWRLAQFLFPLLKFSLGHYLMGGSHSHSGWGSGNTIGMLKVYLLGDLKSHQVDIPFCHYTSTITSQILQMLKHLSHHKVRHSKLFWGRDHIPTFT